MVSSPILPQDERQVDTLKELPKAIDLSHHLSKVSKARKPSYMKTMMRHYGRPGLLALGGGLPHPDCFPFTSLESSVLSPDSFSATADGSVPSLLGTSPQGTPNSASQDRISVPRYALNGSSSPGLSRTMQYDLGRGIINLQKVIQELSTQFFKPAYEDFTTLMHTGNTEGWARIVYTLLNPGDSLLVEEWCYTSAISMALPMGVHMVSVTTDIQGLKADALKALLENWNESTRGFKRPRMMYINPVGQNPCGYTITGERKKQIYDVCVEFDIIIVEDDPYYFLQEGAYVPKKERLDPGTAPSGIDEFTTSLEPSFLKCGPIHSYYACVLMANRYDYQGRVIRMDSFSKTLAPGLRLGWYTCAPSLVERLERQGELSTQAPGGLAQTLVTELLANTWGIPGYVRWLQGLQAQYTARRDTFVDAMVDEFNWSFSEGTGEYEGATVYHGTLKDHGPNGRALVSFVPPTSGMFCWIKVHFDSLPPPVTTPGLDEVEGTHESQFWARMVDEGLLILPGWMFRGEAEHPAVDPNVLGHYRLSFSEVTSEDMKKACRLLTKALGSYFA